MLQKNHKLYYTGQGKAAKKQYFRKKFYWDVTSLCSLKMSVRSVGQSAGLVGKSTVLTKIFPTVFLF